MSPAPREIEVPPYRYSGTVVGALLNDPAQLAALGDAVTRPPHKAPPQAPVLEVKPRHTWAWDGDTVAVPADPGVVTVGASLGIVIGRSACRVPVAQARSVVSGYVLVADLSLPLDGHYRPAVRLKARDGFCVRASTVVPASAVPQPDGLAVMLALDGRTVWTGSTAGRTRGVEQLVAEVSDIMSLQPGDVLLLGIAHGAPLARAGQSVQITMAGLGALAFQLAPEAAPAAAGGEGAR